jgi:uncharacterized protein (TIGR03083 family)
METDPGPWIAELRKSHGRFAAAVERATAARIEGPSYCSDWSFAQVCSHLGSGAQIASEMLSAALEKRPLPDQSFFVAIWDHWNALAPADMAADSVVADEQYVATLEATDKAALERLDVEMWGRRFDAVGLLSMRLFEHAIHVWDLDVTFDDTATIATGAVGLLIDALSNVGRLASGDKPAHLPLEVAVSATDPDRTLAITISGEDVSLTSTPSTTATAKLVAPSEALLRLFYGRLDAAHTPKQVATDGAVTLDELRVLFPGP